MYCKLKWIFLEQFQCKKPFEIQNLNKNQEAFIYCKDVLAKMHFFLYGKI